MGKEIEAEYEKDLKDPERIRERKIARTKTEFSKFALESGSQSVSMIERTSIQQLTFTDIPPTE